MHLSPRPGLPLRQVRLCITLLLAGLAIYCPGQPGSKNDKKVTQDTTVHPDDSLKSKRVIQNIKNARMSKRIVKSITRKQSLNPTATIKSEDSFLPYEGKIIRNIIIRQIGFDKTVLDTAKNIKTTLTRIGNRLHSRSKDWLIRDNLFIRENKPVNPYKMADNERYLRDLDFILDARLFIQPLDYTEDSVDVIVMTKDVFSIGGSLNPRSATETRFRVYDTNLFGYGQRVQFTGHAEDGRDPFFGYEVLYRKNSVAGSFVSVTGAYTQINTGSSYGREQEEAWYIKAERPLMSPYTRLAGGIELSRNWSQNVYHTQDSIFRNYGYRVRDAWVGYNLGANAHSRYRSRHVLTIRGFDQHFIRNPEQAEEANSPIYNDKRYVLGGLTFFKQNFYTARYIYGFGRTEDVPYGHTMSVYLGYSRQLGLTRPYMGVDIGKGIVSPRGYFYNIIFRAGAFNNKGLEDAAVLLSGTLTSRLISYRRFLMRQVVGGDITYIHNLVTTLPLDINNEFGLRGLSVDSLWGTKRLHLFAETYAFTPFELVGFRFAPFVYGELAWLSSEKQSMLENRAFPAIGGGIRTRNENLVFGTVELRLIYYPRTVQDVNHFQVRVSSNLRVKYTASFVRPPTFVLYN
jgi:hypothetical protein